MARHPELSGKIQDLSDAQAYFDEDDNCSRRSFGRMAPTPAIQPGGTLRNDDI